MKRQAIENGEVLDPRWMKRYIEETIGNKCLHCGIGPEWNGKPITLQLDHIDGNNDDHRLENLRILCPNCHTQTDTWCARNKKNTKRNKYKQEYYYGSRARWEGSGFTHRHD